MAGPTLKSRIKRYRHGEILTPLLDEFFRKASVTDGIRFYPSTMAVLVRIFLAPQRDRTGSFSASGLNGCMRAQVLNYLGEPSFNVPSERREAIFFNGHWLHLKWDGILLELGVVRHRAEHKPDLELPVSIPEWNLRGTLDAICVLDGEDWIIDVKGVGPRYWTLLTTGDIPLAYLWQQQAYMRATGIPRAMLLVENKATGEYREVHMPPPDSMVARQMEGRVKGLNAYLDRKELPPQLPNFPHDDQCRECPFIEMCPKAKFALGKERPA